MTASGVDVRLANTIKHAMALVRRCNDKGGLGLDVHETLQSVISFLDQAYGLAVDVSSSAKPERASMTTLLELKRRIDEMPGSPSWSQAYAHLEQMIIEASTLKDLTPAMKAKIDETRANMPDVPEPNMAPDGAIRQSDGDVAELREGRWPRPCRRLRCCARSDSGWAWAQTYHGLHCCRASNREDNADSRLLECILSGVFSRARA